MGAAPCARVERPTGPLSRETHEDLQTFDRALLAQVKKGKVEENYELLEELGHGSFGAAKIMRQTLSALLYLHQANFIFRDLKTENIMFAKPVKDRQFRETGTHEARRFEGEVGNIKLIDFGLCCPFRPGAKITKAAGTPYSVAPELVTPPVQYDQRRLGGWVRCGKEPVSFKNPRWKKISKDAKSSVAELLRKKPENRCSIADALRHVWLKANVTLPSAEVMKGMVETMIQFQDLNMLQKAALTALAWRASDEDTQHLRQIFECLDQDQGGCLAASSFLICFDRCRNVLLYS
eukprot:g25528.t1